MAPRNPPFTVEEIIALEDGIEQRLSVLEDGIISIREEKKRAWNEIKDLVNTVGGQRRSLNEVKRRYKKERKLSRQDYHKNQNRLQQLSLYKVTERKPTFSIEEIIAIEDGVESRLGILEDGSSSTPPQKDNAWNEIRVLVNEVGGNDRTTQAIKRKYQEQRRLQHRDLLQWFA